ncbi:putative oxidoreductase [Podospora australis]|uniref:Oxidoreductase n=1 Tax=Podospora australis TaxID=1536484 RepID=A0AAN6X0D0_9PEZI|nr:putative oxidoreductase [Podospora australis]
MPTPLSTQTMAARRGGGLSGPPKPNKKYFDLEKESAPSDRNLNKEILTGKMIPKAIIITGASRGIGLAATEYLIEQGHKVVLVARTEEKLKELATEYPAQVEYVVTDLTLPDAAYKVVNTAMLHFGGIDAVIINHGVLTPMTRVANSSIEEWKALYDANFFSALALAKESIRPLRQSKGNIIFTSSGAATGAYAAWGAYGSSKAAMNSLAKHIGVEEPDITSVAISPGRVDTDMQKELREKGQEMNQQEYATFQQAFVDGTLIKPEQAGRIIAKLAVEANHELSGKYFRWDAAELAEYRS